LLTSGNFADTVFGLTFVFAPETLVVQGLYSVVGGKIWRACTWILTAVIAISDAIGIFACLTICYNWQRGDLIEAEGSGPLPMLLVTVYFCSSWVFASLLIVAKLHNSYHTPKRQYFAEVCSLCDSVGSVAAYTAMSALVIAVTALLLLEGMGHNFCPTCATFPSGNLALSHRYAERCSMWVSWRHSIGQELCSFPCTEGYDGEMVVLPCFGGVCGNATDFLQCVATTTHTTTTSTTTITTQTMTAHPLNQISYLAGVCFALIFSAVCCSRRDQYQ